MSNDNSRLREKELVLRLIDGDENAFCESRGRRWRNGMGRTVGSGLVPAGGAGRTPAVNMG